MQRLWSIKFMPYIELFQAYYAGKEAREQLALKVLGVFLSLILFYSLWILPITSHLQYLRLNIRQHAKTLSWMQGVDKALSLNTNASPASPLTSLEVVSRLQQQIQASPLASGLMSLKQANDGSIEAQFQNVPFDALIALLSRAGEVLPVAVQRMTVNSAHTTPGVVNVVLRWRFS